MKEFSTNFSALAEVETPEEKPKYDHGYTSEQVETITRRYKEILARDLSLEPVTLEENINVILPHIRLQRTEVFNLNAKVEKEKQEKQEKRERKERTIKEKVKTVREPKEPVVKVKKLTKKFIKEELSRITTKIFTFADLTKEEEDFYNLHMSD